MNIDTPQLKLHRRFDTTHLHSVCAFEAASVRGVYPPIVKLFIVR